jgi:hypothetical protein
MIDTAFGEAAAHCQPGMSGADNDGRGLANGGDS